MLKIISTLSLAIIATGVLAVAAVVAIIEVTGRPDPAWR